MVNVSAPDSVNTSASKGAVCSDNSSPASKPTDSVTDAHEMVGRSSWQPELPMTGIIAALVATASSVVESTDDASKIGLSAFRTLPSVANGRFFSRRTK